MSQPHRVLVIGRDDDLKAALGDDAFGSGHVKILLAERVGHRNMYLLANRKMHETEAPQPKFRGDAYSE